MKRFSVRKRNKYAMSRQGWILSDPKSVWYVYDRLWKENLHVKGQTFIEKYEEDTNKYIEYSYDKKTAQFWADWLNVNRSEVDGTRPFIPGPIHANGLMLK